MFFLAEVAVENALVDGIAPDRVVGNVREAVTGKGNGTETRTGGVTRHGVIEGEIGNMAGDAHGTTTGAAVERETTRTDPGGSQVLVSVIMWQFDSLLFTCCLLILYAGGQGQEL